MAGQNRSSYARSNNGANRGLLAFFRGAFILLVALTLSFGLGFFVIARMVPPTQNDSASNNGAGAGPNSGTSRSAHNERRAQRPDPAGSAPRIAAKPAAPANDGPELLPDTDVQKPEKLGTSGGNPNPNGQDGADSTDPKTHGDGEQNETTKHTGGIPATRDETSDSTGQKHLRRGQTTGSESGAVQTAGSPDSTNAQMAAPSTDVSAAAPPSTKSGVYRVQIGVYSTREKAEEVARSAADKGITTTLHVITREGRTLYRVQHSTRRDRARAERDRQQLQDAGFDATIINPS